MKVKDLERLVLEAAFAAESAYRRGFQHGVNAADYGVEDSHASKFRFDVDYKKAWGAPERCAEGKIRVPWKGISHGLAERHLIMEQNGGRTPTLHRIASDLEYSREQKCQQ